MALIMFFGRECTHCEAMFPLVERLEAEEGISFDKREVWHDHDNATIMRGYREVIGPACGGFLGTPAFYDTERAAAICGVKSYEALRSWVLGADRVI